MHWGALKARILAYGTVRPAGNYRFCPEQSTAGPGAGGSGSVFFKTVDGRIRLTIDEHSPLTLTADADGTARLTGPDIDVAGWVEEAVYHCPRQAYITLSEGCIFSCRYCAVPALAGRIKTAEEVTAMVAAVADEIDAISLTSGVIGSVEEDEKRAVAVVHAVAGFGIPVGASIYPLPGTPQRLRDAGACEVKFNIEAATPALFREMCPGLDYEGTWTILEESVFVFGRNRVFSNVILGLGETDAEMEACIRRLTGIGVIPVIRPLNPSPTLPGHTRPSADRILRMAEFAAGELEKAGLDPTQAKTMCTLCGGCDLVPGRDLVNPPMRRDETGEACLAAALRAAADRFYTVPGYPVTSLGEACGALCTVNEKVALEYALGDAISGRRACLIVKNVGLNACMDPLMNAAVQGLFAGLVIVVGDDTEVSGSQNAQDSRCIGRVAEVPVFAPAAGDLPLVAEAAFRASEQFSRIALVRVTPAVLAAAAGGTPPVRNNRKGTIADPSLTMRGRAEAAALRQRAMVRWAQEEPVPALIYPPHQGPVPSCSTVSPPANAPETMQSRGFARTFCRNCPYIPLLRVMQEEGLHPVLDIGCGLLAKNPPWEVGTAGYGLGSAPAVAAMSTGVALMGDYALMHSGLSALADIREKGLSVLVIIVENGVLGMTGKQAAPEILPYISWAAPVIVNAADHEAIRAALVREEELKCVIIRGQCPGGEDHETVEC